MTTILYLIGKPGTGKYTIAKEIAQYGYQLCDNHLINNTIFALLGSEKPQPIPKSVWDAIEKIRGNVFDFVTRKKHI